MKKMTCRQLGGACDFEFCASTFEEVAALSKKHGMGMFQKKDPAHLTAMQKMQEIMSDPIKMNAWMDEKQKTFDALPDF